jgi:RNA polymerase sigma-70 factor, ECF subfamily
VALSCKSNLYSQSHSSLDRSDTEAAAQRADPLVTAACEGSSTAFAELQSRYSRRLYGTIMSITKNREDAEDVLQDTFLRAFLSLRSFQGRSSFYSWLTRIGINCALMLLRKRRARPEVSFDLPPSDNAEKPPQLEIGDSAPDPEATCIQRQQYTHTLRAIRRLDPSLRTAILLQTKHDYSLKDIAIELEITEAAVKARLYRARARLSSRLSKELRRL